MKVLQLILLLVCIIGGFFTAVVPFSEHLAWVSAISVVVFALPSFLSIISLLQPKKAVIVLLVLGIFAIAIEYIGVKTSIPYGSFVYTDKIGLKLLDTVPWTVPFTWIPLVIGTYTIAHTLVKKTYKKLLLSTLLLLCVDAVIDPGAAALSFWIWENPGIYYGIPFSNYIGWFISGFIGSAIFDSVIQSKLVFRKQSLLSLLYIVTFWTTVTIFLKFFIPTVIGILLIVFVLKTMHSLSTS